MLSFILGLTAFCLYFLYDINSVTRQYRWVHTFFTVGTVLLGAATVLDLAAAWNAGAFSGALDFLLLALAGVCFAALSYCLFFALPFEATYTDPEQGRHVNTCGAYALCRHPGILCFFAMYLFWGLAALPTGLLRCGMVFSLLNLAYAWFQDRVTFPKTFCDYTEYKKNVPFLIPTRTSTHAAVQTLLHTNDEEAVS